MSQANIYNLRKKGLLTGKYDASRHTWWYTVAEVKQARAYLDSSRPLAPGELTARAFEAFRDGSAVQDVVLKLRITTSMAVSLHREWDPGLWCFSSEDVSKLRARLDGRGLRARNPAELLDVIDRLCERDEQLAVIELSEAGLGAIEMHA